jgi:hypothetical protein
MAALASAMIMLADAPVEIDRTVDSSQIEGLLALGAAQADLGGLLVPSCADFGSYRGKVHDAPALPCRFERRRRAAACRIRPKRLKRK